MIHLATKLNYQPFKLDWISFIHICKLCRSHCVMEYLIKSCVSSYSPLSVCSCLVSRDTTGWLDVLDYNHRDAPRPFLIPRRRNTSPPIKRATTVGFQSLYWRIRLHCDKPTLFLFSWENIYIVDRKSQSVNVVVRGGERRNVEWKKRPFPENGIFMQYSGLP